MHSLQSRIDVKATTNIKPSQSGLTDAFGAEPPLSQEELKAAKEELIVQAKFRNFDKCLMDPEIPESQQISLISFIPSATAVPDADGVFGILKVRGSFENSDSAAKRSEYLIKNYDSYHSIYHVYTGAPFPLGLNSKLIKEKKEYEINTKAVEIASQSVRKQMDAEKKNKAEVESRIEDLVAPEEKPDLETYSDELAKRAQNIWVIHKTLEKIKEYRTNVMRATVKIDALEAKHINDPEGSLRDRTKQRFHDLKKKFNVKENDDSFIKHVCEDIDLDAELETLLKEILADGKTNTYMKQSVQEQSVQEQATTVPTSCSTETPQ
jgi:hypothetical protein